MALSKCDALDEETIGEKLAMLKAAARKKPLVVSAVSGRGVPELLAALAKEIGRSQGKEREAATAGEPRPPWQP